MELPLLKALLYSNLFPTIPNTLLCLPLSSLMTMKVMMNEMLMTLMTSHDGKMMEKTTKDVEKRC